MANIEMINEKSSWQNLTERFSIKKVNFFIHIFFFC